MTSDPTPEDFSFVLAAMLKDNIESGRISEDEASQITENIIETIVPDVAEKLLRGLKRDAPAMLREYRGIRRGFIKRNYRRWKEGFDCLEMLIVASQELGGLINTPDRAASRSTPDHKFDALASLHARAVLVSREILCLMTSGFPDGALGRWRTLHEISVVATFLSAQSDVVSERYLFHRNVQAYKAARQYREYEEAANLKPFGDEAFQDIEKAKEEVILKHGKEMLNDWGWAAQALGIKNPTFFDIEKACDLHHWRPRYK